ncbi:MAG: hypothetical protein LBD06_10740 [Candidatus Accumulibacter sp.]|nr:hypothetical protein [Accumulibacter sp.]
MRLQRTVSEDSFRGQFQKTEAREDRRQMSLWRCRAGGMEKPSARVQGTEV